MTRPFTRLSPRKQVPHHRLVQAAALPPVLKAGGSRCARSSDCRSGPDLTKRGKNPRPQQQSVAHMNTTDSPANYLTGTLCWVTNGQSGGGWLSARRRGMRMRGPSASWSPTRSRPAPVVRGGVWPPIWRWRCPAVLLRGTPQSGARSAARHPGELNRIRDRGWRARLPAHVVAVVVIPSPPPERDHASRVPQPDASPDYARRP